MSSQLYVKAYIRRLSHRQEIRNALRKRGIRCEDSTSETQIRFYATTLAEAANIVCTMQDLGFKAHSVIEEHDIADFEMPDGIHV